MGQLSIMSPSDVSSLLQIKESTLRKYSLLLEHVGYKFQRNNQNQRWYNDTDIVVLKKLISLKNSTDMNLNECAEAVFLWHKGESITVPSTVPDSDIKRHNDDMTEIKHFMESQKELIENQNELIKELISKMDQQQKYIDQHLEERDRRLMESIRESQEERKALLQIAAAQEEEKKKRKGIFKWFSKN